MGGIETLLLQCNSRKVLNFEIKKAKTIYKERQQYSLNFEIHLKPFLPMCLYISVKGIKPTNITIQLSLFINGNKQNYSQ